MVSRRGSPFCPTFPKDSFSAALGLAEVLNVQPQAHDNPRFGWIACQDPSATAPEPMRPAKFFLLYSSKRQQLNMWLQFPELAENLQYVAFKLNCIPGARAECWVQELVSEVWKSGDCRTVCHGCWPPGEFVSAKFVPPWLRNLCL